MKRKIRLNYGSGHVRNFPAMTIQPPVFRTVEDAYMHFVRHPEERQLVEDDGEEYTYSAMDDVFDRLDLANTRIGEQLRTGRQDLSPAAGQSADQPPAAGQEDEEIVNGASEESPSE